MKIYNRREKKYESVAQYGGGLLEMLYHGWAGRFLLKLVIHPVFSRINGWYNRTRLSKKKIASFVEEYRIPLEEYEAREFDSFNDFFTRKIKSGCRPVDMDESSFIAPADSKLMVYSITPGQKISIKGVDYTLAELVQDGVDLTDYEGGLCLVFRLTMDDYHRYIFVDHGKIVKKYPIKGRLHTVSSISKEHKIYRENFRVINVLDTLNYGKILWVEVGALLVGKIVNHPIQSFHKGTEKGYFELGGSTIMLLIQKGRVKMDEDILDVCNNGVEVKVQMGERIGGKETC